MKGKEFKLTFEEKYYRDYYKEMYNIIYKRLEDAIKLNLEKTECKTFLPKDYDN